MMPPVVQTAQKTVRRLLEAESSLQTVSFWCNCVLGGRQGSAALGEAAVAHLAPGWMLMWGGGMLGSAGVGVLRGLVP